MSAKLGGGGKGAGTITATFNAASAKRKLTSIAASVGFNDLRKGSSTNAGTRKFVQSFGGGAHGKDDAGHTIANTLGGPGRDTSFIWPQDYKTNRGTFNQFERGIVGAISTGGKGTSAQINQTFTYKGTSLRPSSVSYSATVKPPRGKAQVFKQTFPNP